MNLPAQHCQFFLLRYVPDAVKNEFVNIGLVLLPEAGEPELRFTRDWDRVRCLDPQADSEILEALEDDLRRELRRGNADRDAVLRRMQDSFSNALQPTPLQACLAQSPAKEADALAKMYLERQRVRVQREVSNRQAIRNRMQQEFERIGVWPLMSKNIAAARYTRPGDPLKLDCGYSSNGTVKLFHALSLESHPNSAKLLGFSYPRIAEGIRRLENRAAELAAVIEDDLSADNAEVSFALETLEQQHIRTIRLHEMPGIALIAARELGLA
jgi:hypothetical protein